MSKSHKARNDPRKDAVESKSTGADSATNETKKLHDRNTALTRNINKN